MAIKCISHIMHTCIGLCDCIVCLLHDASCKLITTWGEYYVGNVHAKHMTMVHLTSIKHAMCVTILCEDVSCFYW